MQKTISVRPEMPDDVAAVSALVAAAFGRENEASLTRLLRERGESLVTLVACEQANVVGHVMVSPITLTHANQTARYGGVAPLSVNPAHQGRGIGSTLMHAVIAASRAHGLDALFLLGNPDYYARFGFSTSHVGNAYGAANAFMHLELTAHCLDGIRATARYVDTFAATGT